MGGPIILILAGIAIVIYAFSKLTSKGTADKLKFLTEDQKYYIGDKYISLYARKGYASFDIVGIYYRNLPLNKIIGRFNGYAIAQTDNSHDLYAIAIYKDDNTHIGFIPGGNSRLHAYILREGGKVHAYGYIGQNSDTYFYGATCVESDKSLIKVRNKPY